MQGLSHHEVTIMFLALSTLLATARILGECARRFNQPAIIGEILAGVLLGPTVLGGMFPRFFSVLFPNSGGAALALDGFFQVAIALFLLVAGMELDLGTVWRQGRAAAFVSITGLLFPFAIGFLSALCFPDLLGLNPGADLTIFALFFATALSISALPVIAKTLMDLNLYRSDLGTILIAAAIFNDLTGWIIFAIILGLISVGSPSGFAIGQTIFLTLAFAAFMLTLGKWLIHRILPWLQAHVSWPGGVLGFALSLALLGAAFTEWIGIHAIFGAFLVGVAIGDSRHMREHTRVTIKQFVSFIFAPLFFASIGLQVNFIAHFDWLLCGIVILIACIGKIGGCALGAKLSGMEKREGWALALGMNSRGAMEIILGLLALEYHLITEPMFVALVIMALVTSMMSGPLMQRILKRPVQRHFLDFLHAKTFRACLQSMDREQTIQELVQSIGTEAGLKISDMEQAVFARERLSSTGMGQGIAVPHARLDGLTRPVIAMGLSQSGIDFDAPDGKPAHLIFLILTPMQDDGAQLEILADLVKTFKKPELVGKALEVKNYTEFLALVKSQGE